MKKNIDSRFAGRGMMHSLHRLGLLALVAVFAVSVSGNVAAQSTTSTMKVQVTDQAGNPVNGVAVLITHMPTDRSQTVSSNASGSASARNLQIGGPYVVTSANASQYVAEAVDGVFIELGKTAVVNLTVAAGTTTIEEIVVFGQKDTEELRVGVGRDFKSDTIEGIPSISRDFISTLAIEPKILVDNSVARGPAVSIAGQNFRFNSVTIDGIAQNDNFGLSKNASATQRTPISIDAIQALNVNVAPYDVTFGSFIGGNINIVTKSGTNEFEGSAFGFYTDDSFSGDKSDGVELAIGDFEEKTYGFTVGGPIIQDKLFFFAAYEKFETTLPSNTQTIDQIRDVSQADLDEATEIFNTVYGFDPGRFDATDTDEDEKVLVKLDWNINDNHRAVASYQEADGDVLFDDFPEQASFQSNRYNINEKLTELSLQLFSNWTANLSTEIKFGIKDVENRQISVDSTTPDFAVTFVPFGPTRIAAGGDRFRHANELDNESDIFRFKLDYQMGDHTITAGFEQEDKTVRNLFVPFSKGQYIFFGLDALRNRDVGFVLYGNANSGNPVDAEANFSLATNSFFMQDEWFVNNELTFKYGFRYDKLRNDDPIPLNPAFVERNGFSNTNNLNGNDLFMPRVGFNWTPTDRLTVRGGAGLFGGGEPLIILGNSYSGNGITRTFASFLAPFFGPPISDSITTAVNALPDPGAAFTNFQQYIGVNPLTAVDAISPDFETLSTWKFSIGADYYADLSRWGMGDDWLFSAEVIKSDVKNGYDVFESRRQVVGSAPDGRPIYDLPADGDYIVRNTDQGDGTVFTLNLAKSFDTDHGLFEGTLGYTRTDVEEVRSYNRFVGFETYAFDAQTDLNNPQLANSKYEVPERLTATFNWQKPIWGDNNTRVSLIYTGRSGRHFSHVFGGQDITFGGTFLADFGSEADNPGTQLFYVPTGVNDPIVTGDPQFLSDLDTYINGEGCLSGARGQIVRRNACRTDWVDIFSVRLMQEVPFFGDRKMELILDIENLGNLLNDDWGRVDSYTAPSNIAVANVAISDDGSQYVYSPTSGDVTGPDTIVGNPSIARLPSAWRVQFGVRVRF
jgi:hypothetical protein